MKEIQNYVLGLRKADRSMFWLESEAFNTVPYRFSTFLLQRPQEEEKVKDGAPLSCPQGPRTASLREEYRQWLCEQALEINIVSPTELSVRVLDGPLCHVLLLCRPLSQQKSKHIITLSRPAIQAFAQSYLSNALQVPADNLLHHIARGEPLNVAAEPTERYLYSVMCARCKPNAPNVIGRKLVIARKDNTAILRTNMGDVRNANEALVFWRKNTLIVEYAQERILAHRLLGLPLRTTHNGILRYLHHLQAACVYQLQHTVTVYLDGPIFDPFRNDTLTAGYAFVVHKFVRVQRFTTPIAIVLSAGIRIAEHSGHLLLPFGCRFVLHEPNMLQCVPPADYANAIDASHDLALQTQIDLAIQARQLCEESTLDGCWLLASDNLGRSRQIAALCSALCSALRLDINVRDTVDDLFRTIKRNVWALYFVLRVASEQCLQMQEETNVSRRDMARYARMTIVRVRCMIYLQQNMN